MLQSAAIPGAPSEPSSSPAPTISQDAQHDLVQVPHDRGAAATAAAAAVAERLAALEQAIKRDAEKKRIQWLDEIARLRTPPKPEAAEQSSVSPMQSSKDAFPSKPTVSYASPDQAQPATASPSKAEAPPTSTPSTTAAAPSQPVPSASAVAAAAAADSVSDLYAPPATSSPSEAGPTAGGVERPSVPFLSDAFKPVVDATEAAFETASDIMENISDDLREDAQEALNKIVDDGDDSDDSFVEQMVEKVAQEASQFLDGISQEEADKIIAESKASETVANTAKPSAEPVTEAPESSSGVEERSIGEKLIDAIVEGVDAPDVSTPDVDKSDLIELVQSGKVKNLTVTKLRRLLSANGLKTSGRKSELIARLTSFANAK